VAEFGRRVIRGSLSNAHPRAGAAGLLSGPDGRRGRVAADHAGESSEVPALKFKKRGVLLGAACSGGGPWIPLRLTPPRRPGESRWDRFVIPESPHVEDRDPRSAKPVYCRPLRAWGTPRVWKKLQLGMEQRTAAVFEEANRALGVSVCQFWDWVSQQALTIKSISCIPTTCCREFQV